MAKPFDATTKFLIEEFPRDWLALAGSDPRGPVELVDANLSTITAEADKVIRVGGESPWLVHIEFQSSRDVRLGSRLCRYNILLGDRHDLPVRSVVFLLRPEADDRDLIGDHRRSLPAGRDYLTFRYDVIRVWREPVATFLDGGLGVLPLAPVAALGELPLEAVVAAMTRRIDPVPSTLRHLLWDSTAIVMGLRHPAERVVQLLRGVRDMKESSYYQYILAEGRAEGESRGAIKEARRLLIRLAERRLGPGSSEARGSIEQIVQLDRIERLHDRVGEVSSWEALLAPDEGRDPAA